MPNCVTLGGGPLSVGEISDRILERGLVPLRGKTPKATISAQLYVDARRTNGNAHLQGLSIWAAGEHAARLLPGHAGREPTETTQPAYLQANEATGATGLEPATSGVTGRRSNQLNYAPSAAPV